MVVTLIFREMTLLISVAGKCVIWTSLKATDKLSRHYLHPLERVYSSY